MDQNGLASQQSEKALALIGMDAEVFKKEKQVQDEFDIEDIFEEFNL
jgi:hypothetical protein